MMYSGLEGGSTTELSATDASESPQPVMMYNAPDREMGPLLIQKRPVGVERAHCVARRRRCSTGYRDDAPLAVLCGSSVFGSTDPSPMARSRTSAKPR